MPAILQGAILISVAISGPAWDLVCKFRIRGRRRGKPAERPFCFWAIFI